MSQFRRGGLLPVLGVILGLAVGIIFTVFELVVKEGTDYIWNGPLNTDEIRWRVVPLAIVLGIVFGLVLKLTGDKRIVPIHMDPLDHKQPRTVSLNDMVNIFIVGAASLLAGASLGPEASLVALSSCVGIWLAGKASVKQNTELLVVSGVGALLVAFFGSLVPAIIPILLILKKKKSISLTEIIVPSLAATAAYCSVYFLDSKSQGWGSIPAIPEFELSDLLVAALLGFLASLAAIMLKKTIVFFASGINKLSQKAHWIVTSSLLGGVIGVLYLVGGESVQFNGATGSTMLLSERSMYGAWALAGLLLVKLAVTAWSLAAGYRGGLVFPSVYIGVALSLLFVTVGDGINANGILIGSIAGIFSTMTTPALGFIMLAALLPAKLILVAAAGIAGALLANRVFSVK